MRAFARKNYYIAELFDICRIFNLFMRNIDESKRRITALDKKKQTKLIKF